MRRNRKTVLNIAQAVIIAALALFIILVSGRDSAANVPISQIDSEMKLLNGVTELLKKDDRAVQMSFGYVPAQYLYYRSDDIMDVRELLIAKASDDDEMERIQEAAASRLSGQIRNFTGYGTNQLELLEHAVTMQKGSYYFYGVGDEADEWQAVLLRLIG